MLALGVLSCVRGWALHASDSKQGLIRQQSTIFVASRLSPPADLALLSAPTPLPTATLAGPRHLPMATRCQLDTILLRLPAFCPRVSPFSTFRLAIFFPTAFRLSPCHATPLVPLNGIHPPRMMMKVCGFLATLTILCLSIMTSSNVPIVNQMSSRRVCPQTRRAYGCG